MKYRLLQVGEEIREGDEFYYVCWTKTTASVGCCVSNYDVDSGRFWRRPERRTEIEVMGSDQEHYGLWVSVGGGDEDARLEIESEHFITIPISYAQKLVDAIKEVAGL